MNPAEMINLPPWVQTILTVLAALSLILPAIVRLGGFEETRLGAQILKKGNNVLPEKKGQEPASPAQEDQTK